jgi:hypothetical protein
MLKFMEPVIEILLNKDPQLLELVYIMQYPEFKLSDGEWYEPARKPGHIHRMPWYKHADINVRDILQHLRVVAMRDGVGPGREIPIP